MVGGGGGGGTVVAVCRGAGAIALGIGCVHIQTAVGVRTLGLSCVVEVWELSHSGLGLGSPCLLTQGYALVTLVVNTFRMHLDIFIVLVIEVSNVKYSS